MPDVSHGGHLDVECLTRSGGVLALWTMWIQVGSATPRNGCSIRRLGFGSPATSYT